LAIATELLAYAFKVLAGEFLIVTMLILRIAELALVATITAIVIVIAQPTAIQTPPVVASELIVSARGRCRTMMKSYILISPIDAIRISVAQPFLRNTLSAIPHFIRGTGKLRFFVTLSVV